MGELSDMAPVVNPRQMDYMQLNVLPGSNQGSYVEE